jgi:hypothetical protein
MGNRRGRASTAGSDGKQSFTFFGPPAATDPQRGNGIRLRQKPRFKGARETLSEMCRQVENLIDHGDTLKKAASLSPSTGTTSARSR